MDTTNSYYFWAANAIGNDINAPIVTSAEKGALSEDVAASLECYPNPFNPVEHFRINLRQANGPAFLTVSDVRGKALKSFPLNLSKGKTAVAWNGDNSRGEKMASGFYLVSIKQGNYSAARKILLMK